MKSAVCTLFEGSYHLGLAVLVNSLHRAGFRQTVFAGYRGVLPPWARAAVPLTYPGWPDATLLSIEAGPRIVFLPVTTAHHLTNFKPEFMLALMDGPARDAESLFYLDPDICVAAPWRYFEEWVSCGVALCEDMNSPLPEHHPRRVGWRRYYAKRGLHLKFRGHEYVNGGCVGLRASDRAFLETWKSAMQLMASEIGSLAAAKIGGGVAYRSSGFADCFDCSDQDALNATVEATDRVISVIGQEAMGFKPGAALLPHAVGSSKPWQRSYLRMALRGVAPRLVDKSFWANASTPIAAYSDRQAALKRLDVAAGAAIGRLLRRSA